MNTAKAILIDSHYNITSTQVRQDEKIEFELEYFDKSINGINVTILNTSNKHPAMIGIGSVHTATSSVHYLLCGKHEDTRCPSHCFECGRYTQQFYFKYMVEHYSIPRQYRMWKRCVACLVFSCLQLYYIIYIV